MCVSPRPALSVSRAYIPTYYAAPLARRYARAPTISRYSACRRQKRAPRDRARQARPCAARSTVRAWRRPRGSARSAPRRASKSSSAATLTARRRTTIAMASERCVCARASTICARVSGETRCTSSNQRAHRRQKSAPLDPDVPHECPKLVLNPRGSQRRASRRPPPFQQS